MKLPAGMIDAAINDAIQRTGMPRDAILVLSAAAVTWPDGAMGCPVPGMLYTQALVPGYRIVLQAGSQQLAYHAGREGPARYCPADRASMPAPADHT